MAGVKSNSVGGGSADRRAALLEYAERIRGTPQLVVSIPDGCRLDSRGGAAAVGYIQRKIVDSTVNSCFHSLVDRSILDRATIFSSAQGKHLFCIDRDHPVVHCDTHQRIQPEDPRIFHQNRGT